MFWFEDCGVELCAIAHWNFCAPDQIDCVVGGSLSLSYSYARQKHGDNRESDPIFHRPSICTIPRLVSKRDNSICPVKTTYARRSALGTTTSNQRSHPRGATILLLLTLTPVAHSERLPIKVYTTADGLARDYITRIRQASHGFIWFCTTEGISRFDGYGFTNYGVADGIPHRIVNDFLETRDGAYLFATRRGLVQFEPNSPDTNGSRFTRVELESNELSNWVTSAWTGPWIDSCVTKPRAARVNGPD